MRKNLLISSILLAATILASFCLPKVKYTSPDIFSKLDIPLRMENWRGKDISDSLDTRDLRYNFISRVFARVYQNKYGESLLFLILDAGNFHNPKVCFGMSGATIKDMAPLELTAAGHTFKANCIITENKGESTMLVYWICINKKIVNWTEQKLQQLWYSMFNKQKTGLMVRLEIPVSNISLPSRLKLAQEFINDLIAVLPEEQSEYLFGKP
jgi:EpsI family protein